MNAFAQVAGSMPESEKFRIFIVDDHPILRDGVAQLIETEGTMQVCGETGNGSEVMGLIAKLLPDMVILDLSLDSADGMSVLGDIRYRYPKLPVLVLSMYDELTHAQRCIKAGAQGYLMKRCASQEVIGALLEIRAGRRYVSDAVKLRIVENFATTNDTPVKQIEALSPREFQIYRMYGQGIQTADIAARLNCSPKTVETHSLRIRKKMKLRNLYELIANAGAFLTSTDQPVHNRLQQPVFLGALPEA